MNTNQSVIGFDERTEANDFNNDGNGEAAWTLLELAKKRGMKVGAVSTATITHATPAATYAHINQRNNESDIALHALPSDPTYNDRLGRGLDILMGGGRRFFLSNTLVDEEGVRGGRADGRDLRSEFKSAGYNYVWNKAGFDALRSLPVVGLFESSHMEFEYDRPSDLGGEPSLKGPPTLPKGSEDIRPVTIHILVERNTQARRSQTHRQTVSRTSQRIHIAATDGREWLFERNPVDPRRVSAALVEHSAKAIVLYEESDLRTAVGVRGWADVLTLGFDARLLDGYRRTQDERTIGGIRFARHAANDRNQDRNDVWWSDEQALPSRFAVAGTADVVTQFAVQRIIPGVDAGLLASPDARFPKSRVYDLAGWLERH